MPTGLTRLHYTGNFHFITFSCDERKPYLRSTSAKELAEDSIERARKKYAFVIAGYVIMPEHIHLLISEPQQGSLADAVKAIKLSVTLRSSRQSFWLKRYYDFNVFTPEKTREKLRYMHRNPVVRGLAQRPEDWKWSSFNHYATGEIRTIEIESQWTASRRERATASHVRESGHGAPSFRS